MKTWQAILFGIFTGLLAAGLILLIAASPRGSSLELSPPPTPEPIVIHIAGAVVRPGVYPLPRTSRLIDAVELAGGLLPDADTNAINLAARLMDGDKIVIPFSGETLATVIQRSIETQNGLSPVPASALEKYPIDLNTATLEELLYLPGIGPTKAAEIIAYRQQNGAFQRPEDVLKVPGIGDVTYEQIREFVIAGETP